MFVRGSGCGYRVEWIEDIHACTGDIRHISGDDQVTGFAGFITDAGEALARTGDQTLARWVILDAIEDGAATVAQIARRRGIARHPPGDPPRHLHIRA